MTLEEALNKAAAELPEGTTITVAVERDAGTVECCDEDGSVVCLDHLGDTLAERVIAHLNWLLEGQANHVEADAP
ncbi:MAG: hypothetical protein QM769_04415 [Pseudoxanthomonas sp.]